MIGVWSPKELVQQSCNFPIEWVFYEIKKKHLTQLICDLYKKRTNE